MAPLAECDAYGLAETKNNFSALTAKANEQDRPFLVLKGGRPWVEVSPLAAQPAVKTGGRIAITPVRRRVPIADIDDLFAHYEGDFSPSEDGFARPCGLEEM